MMAIEGEIKNRKRKTQDYRFDQYMVEIRRKLPECANDPSDEDLKKCYVKNLDIRGAVLLFT